MATRGVAWGIKTKTLPGQSSSEEGLTESSSYQEFTIGRGKPRGKSRLARRGVGGRLSKELKGYRKPLVKKRNHFKAAKSREAMETPREMKGPNSEF